MEMSLLEAEKAKKIRLYRNGDDNFFGKEIVVNRRQIRTYTAFLNVVTQHVAMSEQVRSIRTPNGGSVINTLEDLVDKSDYVAVGHGRFKKIGYISLHSRHSQKLQQLKRRKEQNLKFVPNDQNGSSQSRVDRPTKEVVSIYVFCNGDVYEPVRRIVLTPRMLTLWIHVYSEIAAHINPHFGSIRVLCTLDGTVVKETSDLTNNHSYVAVSRYSSFKRLDYGGSKPVFSFTYKLPPKPFDSLHESGDEGRSGQRTDSVLQRTRQPQPPQSREPQVLYTDGREVFPSKARKHVRRRQKTSSSTATGDTPTVDYDRDQGGVFKAKSGRKETYGAVEVYEPTPTPPVLVKRPTDIAEANQVEEEEIEGEHRGVHVPSPPSKQKPLHLAGRRSSSRNAHNVTPYPRSQDSQSGPSPSRAAPRTTPTRTPSAKEAGQPPVDPSSNDDKVPPGDGDAAPPVSTRSEEADKIESDKPDPQNSTNQSEADKALVANESGAAVLEDSQTTQPKGKTKDQSAAATKIQASYRDYKTRSTKKSTSLNRQVAAEGKSGAKIADPIQSSPTKDLPNGGVTYRSSAGSSAKVENEGMGTLKLTQPTGQNKVGGITPINQNAATDGSTNRSEVGQPIDTARE